MAYPRFQLARSFKFARRTAGDVLVSNAAYTEIDVGLDAVLSAQVGDVLEASLSGLWSNENVAAALDAVTVVSGAFVNYLSGAGSDGFGVQGWYANPTGFNGSVGGAAFYTVVAGDLASGLVTIRLVGKMITTARTLVASATRPLAFSVKNLGPVDPN